MWAVNEVLAVVSIWVRSARKALRRSQKTGGFYWHPEETEQEWSVIAKPSDQRRRVFKKGESGRQSQVLHKRTVR